MSSGRLPSLRDSGAGKPGLKFKPKAVARRTKEERDASAPKVKTEEDTSKLDRRRPKKPMAAGQKKRVPRYLNNTHVISTGPLAAGNFVESGKSNMRRGIVRMEGGDKSLVRKGLQSIENHTGDSDEEYDGDLAQKMNIVDEGDEAMGPGPQSKFNMGREYTAGNFEQDNSDVEDEELDMEEDAVQRRRIEELFPVRPLRIRHEDVEELEHKIEETLTEVNTREPTPAPHLIKTEQQEESLKDIIANKEAELESKLQKLEIDPDSHPIDEAEVRHEQAMIVKDHLSIAKKLSKMERKHDRFMICQMPYKLPAFDEVVTKKEAAEAPAAEAKESDMVVDTVSATDVDETEKKKSTKKPKKSAKKKAKDHIPQEELVGNVGSIRIHKSGKITMKIGNSIFNISKGAESTFLQDVIALNEDPEAPGVELLGRVDGKIIATPQF